MYIVGTTKISSQGRIVLTSLFGEKKVKKILPVLDPENEAILLLPIEDDKEVTYGIPSNVDDKNRFIIPRWIRSEFGTGEAILLVDDDKHYIAPKTGHLLPHA